MLWTGYFHYVHRCEQKKRICMRVRLCVWACLCMCGCTCVCLRVCVFVYVCMRKCIETSCPHECIQMPCSKLWVSFKKLKRKNITFSKDSKTKLISIEKMSYGTKTQNVDFVNICIEFLWYSGGRARPTQYNSVVLRRSRATTSIPLSCFEAVARDHLNTTQLFWGGRARPAQYFSVVLRRSRATISISRSSCHWWMMIDDDWWWCLRWRLLNGTCLVFIKKCSKMCVRVYRPIMNEADDEWQWMKIKMVMILFDIHINA